MGVIRDVVYKTGSPPQMSHFVLCHFPQYTGPSLYPGCPDRLFPVFPVDRKFLIDNKACSRMMIPLSLAYAVTIHKSQSLTLNKVVINIGKKEFCTGLSFVPLSRVRRITDLLLHPFPFERLKQTSSRLLNLRKAENCRLDNLGSADVRLCVSPSAAIYENVRKDNNFRIDNLESVDVRLCVSPAPAIY